MAVTNIGLFNGIGPLGEIGTSATCTTGNTTCTLYKFTSVLSNIIAILTISAGLWFIVQIFSGAIAWLSSGGDKQGVQNAQKRISNAIVGLFVVIISYALIGIIGIIFGLDILHLAALISPLHP